MQLLVVCLLSLVALCAAIPAPQSRGCIYIMGHCYKECPVGTHGYTSGCRPKTPEATCDEPNPVQEKHAICDYSACYCDAPTVRDEKSNKCMTLENCPKK